MMISKVDEEKLALSELNELFKQNNNEYSRLEKTWNEMKHEMPEFEKKYSELSRCVLLILRFCQPHLKNYPH